MPHNSLRLRILRHKIHSVPPTAPVLQLHLRPVDARAAIVLASSRYAEVLSKTRTGPDKGECASACRSSSSSRRPLFASKFRLVTAPRVARLPRRSCALGCQIDTLSSRIVRKSLQTKRRPPAKSLHIQSFRRRVPETGTSSAAVRRLSSLCVFCGASEIMDRTNFHSLSSLKPIDLAGSRRAFADSGDGKIKRASSHERMGRKASDGERADK